MGSERSPVGSDLPAAPEGSSASQPDVSLAVPCYNEEDVLERTVTRLIEEFRLRNVNVEIVAVDNGSSDRTSDIIDAMIARKLPVTKAVIKTNHGYGFGVRTGLAMCRGRYIGSIPADGQVDARDVVELCEVLLNSRTPLLAKVRRRFRMDGAWRKFVSVIYNVFANLLFGGLGSIDINGSPKIFPREYLTQWQLQSDDWFLDPEILIKAKRSGLPVFEQNVFAKMREGGVSNVDATAIGEFLVNLAYWRLLGRPRSPGRAVPILSASGSGGDGP